MVKLGLANSRMKDFFDIWLLSGLFSFEGRILRKALENTFGRRRTTFPGSTPFAFTSAFFEDSQKTLQWTAFVKRSKPDIPVGDLSGVIADIAVFLAPVIKSLQSDTSFKKKWLPGQGWAKKTFRLRQGLSLGCGMLDPTGAIGLSRLS